MHFSESDHITSGLWIIIGIIAFLFIENLFAQTSSSEQDSRKIVGYLNLLANSIDNFIHGLAVASSFLNSFKLGFTTVFAILIHEIPHEIGDFAILLNSGFSRYVWFTEENKQNNPLIQSFGSNLQIWGCQSSNTNCSHWNDWSMFCNMDWCSWCQSSIITMDITIFSRRFLEHCIGVSVTRTSSR